MPELTTVADDEAVLHHGTSVHRHLGLRPATAYTLEGTELRTLPRLGERLATVATVNDLHLGETACGVVEGLDLGPVLRAGPGEPPYPELMSGAAVREIAAAAPDAVVVKGDVTADGSAAQVRRFRALFEPAFGDRLHVLPGNHDVARDGPAPWPATGPGRRVDVPGATLALLDSTIHGATGGTLGRDQLDWLDALAADADRPVLVFTHHHVSTARPPGGPGGHFGIDPEASAALVALVARRPRILGVFCGHTHRNRVRRFAATGATPWVEVACVKDFPGTWAEYRVSEGGVLQVHRRISSPAALRWSERARAMFAGTYERYALGTLADRCFALPAR